MKGMNNYGNRDLMIVLKHQNFDAEWLHTETEWLNRLLFRVESTANLAKSCEVINLSRFKIYKNYDRVLKALRENEIKPFVFVFNKN